MHYFAALTAMLSVQCGASLAKKLFPVLGPEGATAYRLFFASFLLCMLWRPWRKKLTFTEIKTILYYGAALAGMNFFFYLSIARAPLGIAVAVEFVGPLSLALTLSRKPLDFFWALLAAAGIALLVPKNAITAANQNGDSLGMLLALIAGVFWALYILAGKKASASSLKGGTVTALGMLIAALLVIPYALATQGASLFHLEAVPVAVAVAVLSSAIPYSLEMFALKKIPAKTFSVFLSLAPALAALLGLIFLDEHLLRRQWLAIFCVVAASLGTTSRRR
jgi:inner membrane transporter RhtA